MPSPVPIPGARLSPRQVETVSLLAQDLTPAEVAERMYVGVHAVVYHLRQARLKLGTRTTTGTVAEAVRRGIVS